MRTYYPDARNFWKFSFEGKTDVLFEDFFNNLCGHLTVAINLSENTDVQMKKALEILSSQTDLNKQKVVSLEKFGLLLKWFGPLTFKTKNIIDKIYQLALEDWFHGEVTRGQLSIYDSNYRKEKDHYFLVRFSMSEPIEEHPFSITSYSAGETKSYHVTFDISTGDYSVTYKDKKKEVVTVTDPDLHSLINFKLRKPLKLKKPIVSPLKGQVLGNISDINYGDNPN